MNRNSNRRIHPIAEADGLSPKKHRKVLLVFNLYTAIPFLCVAVFLNLDYYVTRL